MKMDVKDVNNNTDNKSHTLDNIPVANWLAYLSAWTNSLFTSGIIFGWPSLVLLLKSEGVYREGCSQVANSSSTGVCAAQEVKLNLIFTVGFFGLIGSRLVLGIILDQCGEPTAL